MTKENDPQNGQKNQEKQVFDPDAFIDKLVTATKPITVLRNHKVRFVNWLLVSVVSVGIGLQLLGVRHDISERMSDPLFLIESFCIIFLSIIAASAAFTLSVPGVERTKLQNYGVYGAISVWFLANLIRWSTGNFEFSSGLVGIGCAADTLSLGIAPGILLFYMIRKAACVDLGRSGAMILLGVLGLSGFAVRYSCSFEHPVHLITTHLLPILVLGIVGIYVGKIALKWK